MSGVEEGGPGPEGVQPALVAALRRLLRPLVRFLLDQRIPYTYFSSLLREMYVQVATSDLTLEGRRQTDSRVSLLTGVYRKDVKRIRAQATQPDEVPASVSLGAQIALLWATDPEYQDERGRPLRLPRSSRDPDEPTFHRLVESVSRDIRPRAVLDEWLRLGVATRDPDKRISLRLEGFVPRKGFEEKAFYFGRNLRDHIATATHNLNGCEPPQFERAVYYETLTQESVDELEQLSNDLGMELLRKLNQRAAQLRRRDARRQRRAFRITLGVYFHRATLEPRDGE